AVSLRCVAHPPGHAPPPHWLSLPSPSPADLFSLSLHDALPIFASAGTSFRELRNEIRESFATLYLKDTNVPLESISEKLGFSDQAGFTKAYRSWTGKTPGDVRRQARSKK